MDRVCGRPDSYYMYYDVGKAQRLHAWRSSTLLRWASIVVGVFKPCTWSQRLWRAAPRGVDRALMDTTSRDRESRWHFYVLRDWLGDFGNRSVGRMDSAIVLLYPETRANHHMDEQTDLNECVDALRAMWVLPILTCNPKAQIGIIL